MHPEMSRGRAARNGPAFGNTREHGNSEAGSGRATRTYGPAFGNTREDRVTRQLKLHRLHSLQIEDA